MTDTTRLDEIRERVARDHGIPWSGPQAEKAEEFVADREFLLAEIDRLRAESLQLQRAYLAEQRTAHDEINKIAAMNYEAGAAEGAAAMWDSGVGRE